MATQPVGVPASMGYTITIPDGERGLFLGGRIGPDNYGAARFIECDIIDGGALPIFRLVNQNLDNQSVYFPSVLVSITKTNNTISVLGVPYMPLLLLQAWVIRVRGGSLANTETLSSKFHIATRVFPPTIAAIGAGVNLTTETALQV